MASEEPTKVKKRGDWQSVINFDTEASGRGVMERMDAEDFDEAIEGLRSYDTLYR